MRQGVQQCCVTLRSIQFSVLVLTVTESECPGITVRTELMGKEVVQSPSLEAVKEHLDTILCHMLKDGPT